MAYLWNPRKKRLSICTVCSSTFYKTNIIYRPLREAVQSSWSVLQTTEDVEIHWLPSMKSNVIISDPAASQKKGQWFWWNSKWISLTTCNKTSCAFNTFIQSTPSTWTLPGTLEEWENHNSGEKGREPIFFLPFTSEKPPLLYGKLFHSWF